MLPPISTIKLHTTHNSSIHYLHNPIIHLYYPARLLHNRCLQFLLGRKNVPREVENNAYADFWGAKEVYYGIWIWIWI